jgi:RNA polymerase sigma factor (sigma-70 family)
VTTAATAVTTEAVTTRRSLSPLPGRLAPEAAGLYIGDLFAEHRRMVLGLSRLLLRDPVEAEDAAQQVFLSAHEAVLRGSVPRDSAAWIAAITRNECRARARARMREPLSLPELPSDLPDPLAAAIRAADLQAVWSALGALPRRQRRALVLRELGGLSYHELGRALGVSHSAVESLLFRARQQARAIVAGANARFAAVPVALKVAGAVVSVGVVATGASDVRPIRLPPALIPPRHVEATATVVPALPRPLRLVVTPRRRPSVPTRVRPRRHETGRAERRGRAVAPVVEPVAEHVSQPSEGPGPPPFEPAQLDVSDGAPAVAVSEADGGHDGGDGSSGSDSGSDHSGPG